MELTKKLVAIQGVLDCPKNQTNAFGKYKYRSCEDILEAVKPKLTEHGLSLTLSDEMIEVGGRVYVRATAVLSDGENGINVSACAREAIEQKGMQDSQLTGSTSSYARKYALNGLFCIDDTKDADATNKHKEEPLLGFKDLLDKFNGAKNKFELENIKKKYKKDLDGCSKQEKDDLRAEYKLILKGHEEGAV